MRREEKKRFFFSIAASELQAASERFAKRDENGFCDATNRKADAAGRRESERERNPDAFPLLLPLLLPQRV